MNDTPKPVDISSYLAAPSEPELELRKIYRSKESLVILDIGSCEGEDSVRYSRAFPHSRVFAFEPLPANQALVRSNLARHQVANVELVPIALSNASGTAEFHVSSGRPEQEFAGKDWNYGNKSSSLLPPAQSDPMYGWIEFKQSITVQTDTLDAFCAGRGIERIDFIHMDVQGAEHLVLSGATRMLSRTAAVWLEVSDKELYRGQKLRSDIWQFMHAAGFELSFETRREAEGDQFYVNKRMARFWPYVARCRLSRVTKQMRRAAGQLRRMISGR